MEQIFFLWFFFSPIQTSEVTLNSSYLIFIKKKIIKFSSDMCVIICLQMQLI